MFPTQKRSYAPVWVVALFLAAYAPAPAGSAESGATSATKSLSGATTVSVVPDALISPRKARPTPPPVRPMLRPIPKLQGPVTYVGMLPKNLDVAVPAIKAFGDGDIELQGRARLRISGEGTLWVDKASSVSLSPQMLPSPKETTSGGGNRGGPSKIVRLGMGFPSM